MRLALPLIALMTLFGQAQAYTPGYPTSEEIPSFSDYRSAERLKATTYTRPLKKVRPEDRRKLSRAIGLDKRGEVHNRSETLFNLELDTAAAYAFQNDSIKLGLSAVVWKWASKKGTGFRFSFDVFNDLVGASLRYTFLPVLRPSIGLGYGTYFGRDRDALKAQSKGTETIYMDFTVRLW